MDKEVLPVLAVDLDGTLLRSNMLYESFWSALAQRWAVLVQLLMALPGGRSRIKHVLAEHARIDPATLPYDQGVIDHIRGWRARGGRVALVTATSERLARLIADHLGLFDEVMASGRDENLKGATKARRLCERYGEGGFAYIGDSPADLPVWGKARMVIACNPGRRLSTRLAGLYPGHETLSRPKARIADYLRAIRVHQWAKNPLVFLPIIGAHQSDLATLRAGCLAFLAFSLIASSVYVLNDLLDLSSDRAHPRKRLRPFAAGTIPIEQASWMVIGLFAGGVALGAVVGGAFLGVLLFYHIATTAYSLWLKRKVVVDICTLAGLYTLRVIAGAVAAQVPLSMWMLAFTLFLFFSLAAIKRQAEIVDSLADGGRTLHGRGYHSGDLATVSQMAISSGYVAVLVLALYLNSTAVDRLYAFPELLWGSCAILLYWISRMAMVANRGNMHDDPIVFAATDRVSLCCALLMVIIVAGSATGFGLL
ncbi:UbiA family prenyltransferase [Rhizorhabdus sp. FW153]|uniref:UbiA family prenyltransferase n=1 Tax=Rhizorhabdus sp. FW153 TaxID=3400216 RepID=UPI003CE91B38